MQTASKRKTLLGIVAVVMVCAIAAAGALAYLQAQTKAVTNTFVASGSQIINDPTNNYLFQEHKVTSNDDGTYTKGPDNDMINADGGQTYKVWPGVNIPKDPQVSLKDVTQPAYLFVEVVETGSNWGTNLKYEPADTWKKISDKGPQGGKVYAYTGKVMPADTATAKVFPFLKQDADGNAITVAGSYASTTNETLAFYSYLCQSIGFADEAAAFTACFQPTAP
ncbi:hypothetical protein [Gordonibacter sp.]|uniref:hypothetical protein n=1 Tax=Gordonibacter sp. TaxID=1968902 RepID=UPI0025C5FE18|nr:hypothetical protein [Gordonibacter sp.]